MARGSLPGERRGGRQKGVPNKNKNMPDIKSEASFYGRAAIDRIVKLMQSAKNEQVKFAAAKEILDRAYGRPTQVLAGDKDAPLFPDRIEVKIVGSSA